MVDRWLLVAGRWSVVVDRWLFGCWSVVSGG